MGKPLQDHSHMSCFHPTPTCPLYLFKINVGIFTTLEEMISPDLVWPGEFGLLVKFSRIQLSPVESSQTLPPSDSPSWWSPSPSTWSSGRNSSRWRPCWGGTRPGPPPLGSCNRHSAPWGWPPTGLPLVPHWPASLVPGEQCRTRRSRDKRYINQIWRCPMPKLILEQGNLLKNIDNCWGGAWRSLVLR